MLHARRVKNGGNHGNDSCVKTPGDQGSKMLHLDRLLGEEVLPTK